MERVKLLERIFLDTVSDDIFQAAIDELIANHRVAPLKAQIQEAINLVRKSLPEEKQPDGCYECANTGRVFKQPDRSGAALVAYACNCPLGKTFLGGYIGIGYKKPIMQIVSKKEYQNFFD